MTKHIAIDILRPLLAFILSWMTVLSPLSAQTEVHAHERQGPLRILHIMSYHQPWEWTTSQFAGFKEALQGLDVEYRVFEMDTKRHSDDAWKESTGRQARELIESWHPDLVYISDDNAQEYVTRHYLNRSLPFVFSGVNAPPVTYGFERTNNVTGVLEQEHFVQTIRLLRKITPGVRRIAVISDDGATWPGVIQRMRKRLKEVPDLEVVTWDSVETFAEYKEKILAYQNKVDAIGSLGIFTFKDTAGQNLPYREVLRWTADHSHLPDFSFWESRVVAGTLCAVAVSGHAQGLQAGQLARKILVEGQRPVQLPMLPSRKGEPIISLRRARQLGISIPASSLLSSKVITDYEWDK